MSANYCNKHPDWKGWSSEDCPHCYPPEIDDLEEQRDSSQRRILELELEVKRLREVLQAADYQFGRIATADWGIEQAQLAAESEIYRIRQALSTPPPALAEAYVRLRDVVAPIAVEWTESDRLPRKYFESEIEAGNKIRGALAEVERLEMGE